LIHGEGDQLPGLIADYYNGIVVLQMHTLGMYRLREMIAEIILEVTKGMVTAVYDKSSGTLPAIPGLDHQNGWLAGGADPSVMVKENGFKFEVDFVSGQKTGFFIDQRENRLLASKMSKGREVLNLFGYTGGFSVYALKSANSVHTVDSSASAIEIAERNIRFNYPEDISHQSFTTDAFGYLDGVGDKYDMIILDPPAFAKHNNVLSNALQGYKRLNRKAFDVIRPGGILFTFSCSQVVSRENFRKSVFVAAANAGRSVRILHQLSQPPDHPVNIFHPESEYLKGLVLYVE
jgi:23S rRNA (cytosine1962-C5)-methyltransferase